MAVAPSGDRSCRAATARAISLRASRSRRGRPGRRRRSGSTRDRRRRRRPAGRGPAARPGRRRRRRPGRRPSSRSTSRRTSIRRDGRVQVDRRLDQRRAVRRVPGDRCAGDPLQGRRRAPHRHLDAVDQRPQRVRECDARIVLGREVRVDRRGDGAAGAVAQHDQQLQAVAELVDRVVDAPQALDAQHVARHPDDEQVVERLVEDPLDRHPGVGAAQHQRERGLDRRGPGPQRQAQRQRIGRDHDLAGGSGRPRAPCAPGSRSWCIGRGPGGGSSIAASASASCAGRDRLVGIVTIDDIHMGTSS